MDDNNNNNEPPSELELYTSLLNDGSAPVQDMTPGMVPNLGGSAPTGKFG